MQNEEYDLFNSHLIRQCRDWQIDNNLPSSRAFMLRNKRESHLSFNWLEKICVDAGIPIDYDEAIKELEKSPPLEPRQGYMWAILTCEKIRSAVKKCTCQLPEIFASPSPGNPSHVSVGGWVHHSKRTKKKIALELASQMTTFNTRPCNVPSV